jgi:vancomycin resistance protein VanW
MNLFSLGKKYVSYSVERQKKAMLLREQLILTMEIPSSVHVVNKRHNINLAIDRIENIIIHPGEILSFWKMIGKPGMDQGYLPSRYLRGDQLHFEAGGGLCQFAAMLYFLSVKSGLEIIERHHHQFDMYSLDARYTPLGSDAHVDYPEEDLKIKNSLRIPVCFRFDLSENLLTGYLCADNAIQVYEVEFEEEKDGQRKQVKAIRSGHGKTRELISYNVYREIFFPRHVLSRFGEDGFKPDRGQPLI